MTETIQAKAPSTSKTVQGTTVAPAPTVHLDQPIQRDGQTIENITLRRPTAGELRGLHLVNVLQMEVDTLATLLPRICIPTIHRAEVLAMDPADLLAAGVELAGFFQQKGTHTESQAA